MTFRNTILGAISTLLSVAGVAVTYSRDASSVKVTATPGKTDYERESEDGVAIRSQARDFLIRVSDLVAIGEPARGDTIVEISADGDTHTYEVLPLADELWRFTDQFRT